jgi:hypothetical protein
MRAAKPSHRRIVSSASWAGVPRDYDLAMRGTEVPAAAWRTPQELVQEGFRRNRVVMLNQAHDGLTRWLWVLVAVSLALAVAIPMWLYLAIPMTWWIVSGWSSTRSMK